MRVTGEQDEPLHTNTELPGGFRASLSGCLGMPWATRSASEKFFMTWDLGVGEVIFRVYPDLCSSYFAEHCLLSTYYVFTEHLLRADVY